MNYRLLNRVFIGISLFCFSAVFISILKQQYGKIEMCPLCSIQRFLYLSIGCSALLGFHTNEKSIYQKITISLLAGLIITSGYHLLIQKGIVSDFCTKHSPIPKNLFEDLLITASKSQARKGCSIQSWTFLGQPISTYNLIFAFYFLIFIISKQDSKSTHKFKSPLEKK